MITREGLIEGLPYWPDEPIEWEKSVIVDVARLLSVSQQAIALRLEELGIAPPGFYGRFKEKQGRRKPRGKAKKGPRDYTIMRAFDLGRRFPRTILSAVNRGFISTVDATAVLNTRPHLFQKLSTRVNA